MPSRTRPYTPWYQADYTRSAQPAHILVPAEFERRHWLRLFQGIPSIESTRKGTLYAAWYSGGQTEGPDNFVLLARKRPCKAWEIPYRVIECVEGVRAFDPVLWIDPSGRLHLFWTQAHLFFDGREGVWESVCEQPDAEETLWTSPRRLCDGVMLNKPTVLADGRWFYTVARVGLKRFHGLPAATVIGSEGAAEACRAQVWESQDNGKTIAFCGEVVDAITDFGEHMVYECSNGRLIMLLRAAPFLRISQSMDGGRTWSDSICSDIPSPCSRFHVRRLSSGRLLLINHATSQARNQLCAYLSEDDGKSWGAPFLLDAREQVSYPDARQTADGRIHILYDRDRYDALEILYSCVTEEDLLAGRLLSPASRLMEVVDHA